MRKLILFIFVKFLFLNLINVKANEIKIITKVETEIITNIDIENEYKYLTSLNNNYKSIEKEKIFNFAKESLIKEKIKVTELKKYFDLGGNDLFLDKRIENIYRNLGFNDVAEFKDYLETYDLKIETIYNKIEIELKWNKLIFDKYKNQILINKDALKKKLIEESKDRYSYNVSELTFSIKNRSEFDKKYKQITKSINEIGFEKTILIYSNSNSVNNSGNLGWIDQISLSKIILNELQKINVNEITNPIRVANGIVILKLNDKKKIDKVSENIEKELLELINFERTKQLNTFSSIHFNKIKNKTFINES